MDSSKVESFAKGEYIITEGENSKKAYIVISGIVSVEKK
jgi:CRP-like cAMP-binding protein